MTGPVSLLSRSGVANHSTDKRLRGAVSLLSLSGRPPPHRGAV